MRGTSVAEAVLSIDASRRASLTILGPTTTLEIAYEQVADIAARRATGLAEQGVRPGAAVGVYARTSLDFVTSCFGIWRMGAAVVPLAPPPPRASIPEWTDRLGRALVAARADAVLCGRGDPLLDLPVRSIDPWTLDTGGAYTGEGPQPSDVAVIQFSSGSTSEPKGVVLDHRAVTTYVAAMCDRAGPTAEVENDLLMSWLPMFHDLGFVNFMIRPLTTGFPVVLMPTEQFIKAPVAWMQQMSLNRATITSGPNVAYGLVARELERSSGLDLDLSACRYAGNGGEAVDVGTLERFADATSRYGLDRRALAPGYGLAEGTCSLTARTPLSGWVVDHVDRERLAKGEAVPATPGEPGTATFVSVGRPLKGIEVEIVGEGDETLGDRRVGEIVARSSTLMRGYLGDSEAGDRALRDGRLHTGDVGYLVDGELFVTGRVKDVIIIGGHNYYAEDIERIVQTVPGIRRGGCVAISARSNDATESIAVLVETRAEADELTEIRSGIASKVLAGTGMAPATILFLEPRSLPKTTSGKLKRSEARRMLEEGAWIDSLRVDAPPVRGPRDELEGFLHDIYGSVLGLEGFGIDDDFFELGGTSLQAASVIVDIGNVLGRPLASSAIIKAPTVEGLANLIRVSGSRPERTSIVPLAAGPGREMFTVPGAGGRALPFMALARSMGKGFSMLGFEEPELLAQRQRPVEALAKEFVALLLREHSEPYRLIGFSMGGLVAYEMAAQLISEGRRVGFVGLIDTAEPVPRSTQARLRRLKDAATIRRVIRKRLLRGFYYLLAWANRSLGVPLSLRRRYRLELVLAMKTSRHYRPTRYKGRVDYFRVVSPGDRSPKSIEEWIGTSADLHVHDVPAPSHMEVMRRPWVEGLALAVQEAVEEIEG